jgi:hypothetical protein
MSLNSVAKLLTQQVLFSFTLSFSHSYLSLSFTFTVLTLTLSLILVLIFAAPSEAVEVYYDTVTTPQKFESTADNSSSSGEEQTRSTATKLIKPFKEIGKKVKQLVEGEHGTKRTRDGESEGDEKSLTFSPEKKTSQEKDDDIMFVSLCPCLCFYFCLFLFHFIHPLTKYTFTHTHTHTHTKH